MPWVSSSAGYPECEVDSTQLMAQIIDSVKHGIGEFLGTRRLSDSAAVFDLGEVVQYNLDLYGDIVCAYLIVLVLVLMVVSFTVLVWSRSRPLSRAEQGNARPMKCCNGANAPGGLSRNELVELGDRISSAIVREAKLAFAEEIGYLKQKVAIFDETFTSIRRGVAAIASWNEAESRTRSLRGELNHALSRGHLAAQNETPRQHDIMQHRGQRASVEVLRELLDKVEEVVNHLVESNELGRSLLQSAAVILRTIEQQQARPESNAENRNGQGFAESAAHKNLKDIVDTLKGEVAEMKLERHSQNSEIRAAERFNPYFQAHVDRLSESIVELQTRLYHLEETAKTDQNELRDCKGEIDSVKQHIPELRKSIQHILPNDDAHALRECPESMREKFQSLSSNFKALEESLASTDSAQDDIGKQITAFSMDIAKLKELLDEIQEDLHSVAPFSAVEDLFQKVNDCEARWTKQIETVEDQLQAVQNEGRKRLAEDSLQAVRDQVIQAVQAEVRNQPTEESLKLVESQLQKGLNELSKEVAHLVANTEPVKESQKGLETHLKVLKAAFDAHDAKLNDAILEIDKHGFELLRLEGELGAIAAQPHATASSPPSRNQDGDLDKQLKELSARCSAHANMCEGIKDVSAKVQQEVKALRNQTNELKENVSEKGDRLIHLENFYKGNQNMVRAILDKVRSTDDKLKSMGVSVDGPDLADLEAGMDKEEKKPAFDPMDIVVAQLSKKERPGLAGSRYACPPETITEKTQPAKQDQTPSSWRSPAEIQDFKPGASVPTKMENEGEEAPRAPSGKMIPRSDDAQQAVDLNKSRHAPVSKASQDERQQKPTQGHSNKTAQNDKGRKGLGDLGKSRWAS